MTLLTDLLFGAGGNVPEGQPATLNGLLWGVDPDPSPIDPATQQEILPLHFVRWAGGNVEGGNAYEITMNASELDHLSDGLDGMELYVVGTVITRSGTGLLETKAGTDILEASGVQTRIPAHATARLPRRTNGLYRSQSLTCTYNATTTSTVLGMRLTVLGVPGLAIGDVESNKEVLEAIGRQVSDLSLNLLHDLRPGTVTPTWGEVADSVVGLSDAGNSGSFQLANAVSMTYSHRLARSNYGFGGKFIFVRLPRNSNTSEYRLRRSHDFTDGRDPFVDYQTLNSMHPLGFSGVYDYYQSPSFVGDWVTYQLEKSDAGTHIGTTEYLGNLDRAKVLASLGLPADLSGKGGQIIQIKEDATGFEFVS